MLFNSLAFLVFFPLVFLAYYACRARFRWLLLLAASCYFYMAFVPYYILILFFLIGVDFFLAQRIERAAGYRRKLYFLGSVIANIGMLFVFKYFNFFNENIAALAQALHWNYSIASLKLILPLGLSFHIFQSLAYVIEVYRGKYPAERHLGIYALYVLFFPQLVAGPIERPHHLLPQFKKIITWDWANIFSGLRLATWGFFKKIVIADRLAASVDFVFGHVATVPGLSILITIIFFAFQLYADFSGYSDIARGCARMLGIELSYNFVRPYFARSVAEFWRRWHISLSGWFRDYLYFPLVYAAANKTRRWLYACLFITFLITGVWHGAGWTFVMLGALHGTYLVSGLVSKSWRERTVKFLRLNRVPRLHGLLQRLLVFALVSFSWIFFRAPSLSEAWAFIARLGHGWQGIGARLWDTYYLRPFDTLGFSRTELILSVGGICLLLGVEYAQERWHLLAWLARQPLYVRTFVYSGLAMAIVIFGAFTSKQFIYFQF